MMSRSLCALSVALAACVSPELPARTSPIDLAAPPPAIALSGTCPGSVTVDVAGATASGQASLYWAASTGSRALSTGPCAGRITGLGNTPYKLGTVTASAAGTAGGPLNVPQPGCSGYFQVLDETSCTLSATVAVSSVNAPTAAVAVQPASPSPCDELTCTFTTPPPSSGGPYTYSYSWSVNGTVATTGSSNTLAASHTSSGDVVTCTATATDGVSSVVAEATATVGSTQVTERFTIEQDPVAEVDLLMVVDNSCSMLDEQSALATLSTALMDTVTASGADVHVGVVTTDMDATDQQGALQVGNGYLYVTGSTPNGGDALADAVIVGNNGSSLERGLYAAHAALTEPLLSTANAGFRRTNADLAFLFLTDERDQSAPDVTHPDFVSHFSAAATASNFQVTSWPLVGPSPLGCIGASGQAEAGSGYLDVSRQLGGTPGTICAPTYAPYVQMMAGVITGKPRHVSLSTKPSPGTMGVFARLPSGQTVVLPPSMFTVDPASGALVFGATPPDGTEVLVRYDPVCGP